MPKILGHVITDDIVVNYKKSDRDDCLHFLTHLDTSCHVLSSLISPTAKRIYTSTFNAWFLKINFEVKHIDVQGFDYDKSYKISFKGNTYIYSFIDTKFSTGSVALLLHGTFGSYLYTGNFCYYPSFVRSPVLLPVIQKRALTRLYLDNTYYEKQSNFLGFHEIASRVTELIKSEPSKNFYIYAEKVTMDPLITEIASRLEEKVYICQSTMEIMKFLNFESFFTRHSHESRIFINKTLIKHKNFESITIYLNRFSDPCNSFQKNEKKGNVYNFNFYCHSNHKEICELLRILKPESMTFLFSEIDQAKVSYNLKIKHDSQNVQLKCVSPNSLTNLVGSLNKIVKNPGPLISPKIINEGGVSRGLSSKTIIIPKNKELLNLNEGGENSARTTFENQVVTNLPSTEYKFPLRIRKVPEINNVASCKKANFTVEDNEKKLTEQRNANLKTQNNSKEINYSTKNPSNPDVKLLPQLETSSQNMHHKLEPMQFIKSFNLNNINSTRNKISSNNIKVIHKKVGIPLVFNSSLENGLNGTNSKIMGISETSRVSNGKTNSVYVTSKYLEVKNPSKITLLPDNNKNTKLNFTNNENNLIAKKPPMLLESNATLLNSNIVELSVLKSSTFHHDLKIEDSISVPNNYFEKLENRLNEPAQSTSFESALCVRDDTQLEVNDELNNIDKSLNSELLSDSFNPKKNCDINQLSTTHNQPNDLQNCNENNNDISTSSNSVICDEDNTTVLCNAGLSIDPNLKNKITLINNEHKVCQNNSTDASKNSSNATPKRCLTDSDNMQSRKKLRSDHLRQCQLQSNLQQKETESIKDCYVLLKPNGFEKSYFYSSQHGCYLPKFCGFKKHEVRPRTTLINLRNLKNVLKN